MSPATSTTWFEDKVVRLVQCGNCKLVFQNPQLHSQSGRAFENVDYTRHQIPHVNQTYRKMFSSRLIELTQLSNELSNRPLSYVLDVGCGLGLFLDEARRRGYEVAGVEPSAYAKEWVNKNLGIDIINGLLEDAEFVDSTFDLIHLNHVLEHVPRPVELLREVHRILKPNGFLYIEVPRESRREKWFFNLLRRLLGSRLLGREQSQYASFGTEHLLFFSDKALEYLLAETKFTILKHRHETFPFSVSIRNPRLLFWVNLLKRLGMFHLLGSGVNVIIATKFPNHN
jgi:SAM-dependent methyltransferase